MKPSMSSLHGSPERSAFSWTFGWLVPFPYLGKEHLQEHVRAKVKGAAWALQNIQKLQTEHNCVVFYIPKSFKEIYRQRFAVTAKHDDKWFALNYKICGMQMSAVPLPKHLGTTVLNDVELSSKNL